MRRFQVCSIFFVFLNSRARAAYTVRFFVFNLPSEVRAYGRGERTHNYHDGFPTTEVRSSLAVAASAVGVDLGRRRYR